MKDKDSGIKIWLEIPEQVDGDFAAHDSNLEIFCTLSKFNESTACDLLELAKESVDAAANTDGNIILAEWFESIADELRKHKEA